MNRFSKKFVDKFNHAAKNSSRANLFDDFLKISVAVLQRDETAYSEIADKDLHCELFGLLAAALDDCISQKILQDNVLGLKLKIPTDSSHKPRYRDELGEIFRTLELFDQSGGQVFTPQHVADIMGETTLTAELIYRELDTKGYVPIIENCCGSGALILGGLNALLKLGVNPNHFAIVFAGDTDIRCVQMTFIQLSLYMIPGVVVQRNAVTNESFGGKFVTPILQRRINHEDVSNLHRLRRSPLDLRQGS